MRQFFCVLDANACFVFIWDSLNVKFSAAGREQGRKTSLFVQLPGEDGCAGLFWILEMIIDKHALGIYNGNWLKT